MEISQEQVERAIYRSRMKYLNDRQSDLNTSWDNGFEEGWAEGWAKGWAKGWAEGREKGIMGVARSALRKNIPIDTVAEVTGLSREVLEQLAAEQ